MNPQNKMKIHNFRLYDLFIYILLRWRGIAIAMLAIAVIFGSYKNLKDYKKYKDNGGDSQQVAVETEEEKAEKRYAESIEKYEQYVEEYAKKEKAIEEDQKRVDELEKATKESIKMSVNPYQCPQAVISWTFSITPEVLEAKGLKLEEAMDPILNSYDAKIKNGLDYSYAIKELNCSEESARDVLTITTDLSKNIQTLKVIGDTSEHADAIAKDLMKQIEAMQPTVTKEYCEHKIKQLSYTSGVIKDSVLVDEQKKNEDYLLGYRNQLANDMGALRNMAIPKEPTFEDCLRDIRLEEANKSEQDAWNNIGTYVEPLTAKKAIKNYVFGAIGGLIVACGILCIKFLGQNVLRGESELEDNFDLFLIGCFKRTYNESKYLQFVDKGVKRIVFGKEEISSEQEREKILAILDAIKKPYNKLMISAYAEDKECQELAEHIKANLVGTEVFYTDDLLNNPIAISSLDTLDGIVLIEKRDFSKLDDICNKVTLAKKVEKPIVGVIAL